MRKIFSFKFETSDEFKDIMIKCISNAVGEDIIINSQGLKTQIGTPDRIWDCINTNLGKYFNSEDVIAEITKRGRDIVPVFDRKTGMIHTLMREKRFEQLRKELPKRRRLHYIDALSRSLNRDLRMQPVQKSLFLIRGHHKFDNEKHIKDIVEKIFKDLAIPGELVKKHGLILFNSHNNMLVSIRCCVIDSNLNIINYDDWSNRIKATESIIPEKSVDITSIYDNPTMNLQYKQKAKDRKKSQPKPEIRGKNTKKENR